MGKLLTALVALAVGLLIMAGFALLGAAVAGTLIKLGWWFLSMESTTGYTLTWRVAIFCGWCLALSSARVESK